MDFTLPLLAISSLLLLRKSNKGSSTGNLVNGKYKPKPQPVFKNELDNILTDLESKLEIEDLRDFLMGVAWVESKYFPSAIAYVTIDPEERWPSIKKLYKTNKYINQKYLWDYTGGLFQLFPSSVLKTSDHTAMKNDPTTVFNPYYAIAYAIDLASRLENGANTWFDIRLGWASSQIQAEKPPDKVLAIEDRIVKGIENSGGDVEILYKYVPGRFDKYRSEYGFQKTLKYIQSIKVG